MIKWLNENTGAIQAAATVVLVFITFWYVRLTKGILNEARRSQRPYVYLDLAAEKPGTLDLGVGNFGDRAAEDVTFKVTTDLFDRLRKRPMSEAEPFRNGIAYLPPNRRYGYDVLIDDTALEGPPGRHVLNVVVSYRGGGRKFEDEVRIDMASFNGLRFSSFAQPGTKVAEAVNRLGQKLKPSALPLAFTRRACPVCGEMVQSSAKKCRHCHEWIEAHSAVVEAADATVEMSPVEELDTPNAESDGDEGAGPGEVGPAQAP